ncbi:ArdC-like ssDNA-binding domain-containing protein [Sporosarcina sp. FSL K6-5500]|uniref:ArdC-like ssDNA-binding domain-containing protein n=1 Tax=Sporosarcina sp. FSL K6-5500 TaxID=2921558 RepID=UPI0030FBC6C5
MPLQPNKYEERTKELTARLEEQLTQFANQEDFKRYLHFMASMRQYSIDNQILVFMQDPKATYVAGFQAWKKHQRFVQKGEKGIQIRAPIFEQHPVLDRATKKPLYDEKGNPKMDTVLVRYKWVTVFDIAQTDGEPLKVTRDFVNDRFQTDEDATALYENMKNYLTQYKQLNVAEKAYSIQEKGRGYYVPSTNEIVVNATENNPVAKLRTLIHEFAHAQLHGREGHFNEASRAHKEAQAESVACATMAYLGFDTSHFSLGYIATWAKDTDLMRQALTEIQATLEKTLATIDIVLHPQLYEQLQQVIQNPMLTQPVVHVEQLAKSLPAFQYVKSSVTAVEVFDARYNGFEIAKYHRQPQELRDERGEVITREMLKGKEIILMNVIDQHPAAAKMYKSFSEQFALQEVYGPESSIELYHKATNTPIVDYQDVKEAKSSFLHAAESENHLIGAYVYGKEELRSFKPVLEGEQKRIERVQGGETNTRIAGTKAKKNLDYKIQID